MKRFLLICILLPASALLLFSKSLKIADSIIFKIPVGWAYVDSESEQIPQRGKLSSAILENPASNQKLTVSVLTVDHQRPDVQYSTELIDATLAPWIQAARDKGIHPNPGRSLARGNFIFYSQELGYPNAPKLELRGVLMKKGKDWVNFFCSGSGNITWEQYRELINGTKLLNPASN